MKTHGLAARRTAQRPGSEAQLQNPGPPANTCREHLLVANTRSGLAAAAGLELTPGSSRGDKPEGPSTSARKSVRLRFQLRRLWRICLAVCKEKGERKRPEWFDLKGIECETCRFLWVHPAWRAPVSFPPLAQSLHPGGHRPGSSSAVALPHCNKPPASVVRSNYETLLESPLRTPNLQHGS